MNIQNTVFITMAMLLIACSENESTNPTGNSGNEWIPQRKSILLKYDISNGQLREKNSTTRSDVVEYNNDLENYDISVTATLTEEGSSSEETYFSDVLQFEHGWSFPHNYYWPAGKQINSYALAPHNPIGVVTSNSVNTLNYTVPYDNSDQCDLMYAYTDRSTLSSNNESESEEEAESITLCFLHALASLGFKAKTESNNISVEIAGIDVCNVYKTGTFTFPSTTTFDGMTVGELCTWSNLSDRGDISAGITVSTLSTLENLDLTGISGRLMMLPQTLTAWDPGTEESPVAISNNVNYLRIHCKLMSNGRYFTGTASTYGDLYVPFSGVFEMGKHYSYTLEFGTGYNADGTENARVEIALSATITDWNSEVRVFDQIVL